MSSEAKTYMIEDFTYLSQSSIWNYMSLFYDQKGVDAWADTHVPYFVTSNAFIAHKYALLLVEILKKHRSDQPTYILELGAGSGQFSFLVLNALMKMGLIGSEASKVTYVMSDFTERNLAFWEKHSAFELFRSEGCLDFSQIDLYRPEAISLRLRGQTLPSDAQVIVIANYLMDSISCESYRYFRGELFRNQISLQTKEENLNLMDLSSVSNIFPVWKSEEKVSPESNTLLNSLLSWYLDYFSNRCQEAYFTIPFHVMKYLEDILLKQYSFVTLIAGDKAQTNPSRFVLNEYPHIAPHGGAVSLVVNFHAIEWLFAKYNGSSLHHDHDNSLKISMFSTLRSVDQGLPKDAYQEHIVNFGPVDFLEVSRVITSDYTVEAANALLKLSRYDPDLFFRLKEVYFHKLEASGLGVRLEFVRCVKHLLENYYWMKSTRDLYFELSRIFHKVKEYRMALTYLQKSRAQLERFDNLYCTGLCYLALCEKEQALVWFQKAIANNPSDENCKQAIRLIESELECLSLH